jgi:HSP20 family protein
VNIADLDDRYEVAAEIPGVPKEGIEVDVSDDRLEIRAERSLERSEEKDGAQYREIGRSAFYRVLPLPHDADGDKVEAKLDHGVLTVTLPKVEARAPKKRVAVK